MTQVDIIIDVLNKHKINKYRTLFRDCMADAMNEWLKLHKPEPSFTLEDMEDAFWEGSVYGARDGDEEYSIKNYFKTKYNIDI